MYLIGTVSGQRYDLSRTGLPPPLPGGSTTAGLLPAAGPLLDKRSGHHSRRANANGDQPSYPAAFQSYQGLKAALSCKTC